MDSLVRFLFELLVHGLWRLIARFGHAIARVMVPALSRGRIRVEPLSINYVVVRRWHGLNHLTDGSPVMGTGLASIVGLCLFAAALLVVLVALKWLPS